MFNKLSFSFVRTSITILVLVLFASVTAGECKECVEVGKGKIPAKFLDKSLKELPSGITIWDVAEAMHELQNSESKVLWVDTRPNTFYSQGTIKKSVLLIYDLKGNKIPDSDKDNYLSKEKLEVEMKKVDPDIKKVKVAFFCQGPKCHRSYNAAIHVIEEYDMNVANIIWFRDGYPNLESHISESPKLNKRKLKYLKGASVAD